MSVALLGFVVAGCGGDDSDNGGDDTATTETTAGGDGPAAPDIPTATIAYVEPAAVDEVTQRNVEQVKFVAEWLGWELKFHDGQGDIASVATALETYVNEGVDAVITGSTDAALVEAGLSAAQAEDIPTMVIGGGVTESDLYDGQFTEDEARMSELLTEQMVEDLGSEGEIFTMDISQLSSGTIRAEARDGVLADTDIEIVASQEGDLADPIQGTRKMAAGMIQANPNVAAGWLVYDYMLPPTMQVVEEQGLDEQIGLYTWFAGPENAALLREHEAVRALIENNFDHTALVAMDQILNHVVNGEFNPAAIEECPLKYEVVTKDNVPEPDTRLWEPEDNRTAFLENWSNETFGEGADCG